MTISEAIGHVVRAERTKKKMAQSELGRRMKSPRTYISKIENGHAAPSIENFVRVAEALGLEGPKLLEKVIALSNDINEGRVALKMDDRRRGHPTKTFIVPANVVDPAAIARRKKLAMALGTLPQEAT